MRKYYSRLSRLEEKRSIRSAFVFGVLTIGILILMVFFGIPLVTKFAGIVTDIKQSNQPIQKNDTTPPPPPNFNYIPDFTNQNKIVVSGNTEAGATVTIYFNDTQTDVVSDNNGNFSSEFNLSDGANSFYGIAKDKSGNKSNESQHYKVTLDKKAPKLTISSPHDGDKFLGDKNKQISIQGMTDPSTQITINDRFVSVSDDGSFKYQTTLSDGDNNFSVKAIDSAGNKTEQILKVNYSSGN
ncbi:MAG: hypothetical protein HY044_03350 [Candidatus Woesebacteria bacterium]|nr:MAG: hypothetical protein HY044_03350 [Candidatus Woesebacteria bacterium]